MARRANNLTGETDFSRAATASRIAKAAWKGATRKASAQLLLHVNPNGNVDVQNSVKTKLDTQTTFITTATSWREVIAMCDVEGYDNVVVRFGDSIRPLFLRYAEAYDND